jgi:hypothetical protein
MKFLKLKAEAMKRKKVVKVYDKGKGNPRLPPSWRFTGRLCVLLECGHESAWPRTKPKPASMTCFQCEQKAITGVEPERMAGRKSTCHNIKPASQSSSQKGEEEWLAMTDSSEQLLILKPRFWR